MEATTLLYDDQPDRALRAAQQGVALAPAGSVAQIRLAGQLARTQARLGHTDPAADALNLLCGHAERQVPHARGLFSSAAAQSWSVAATTSLCLGHSEQARAFADQAMEVYGLDPRVSPTRRAITALELGIACARLGDPEQAVTYGMAAISTPRYSSAIVARSSSLGATLERTYPEATVVAQFSQDVATLKGRAGGVQGRLTDRETIVQVGRLPRAASRQTDQPPLAGGGIRCQSAVSRSASAWECLD
ncbi:hypothetical protein ACQPYK_50095 (plasmid) [Streptosporangium sp. CA-135522]|uniref:hypothetical protein n=1 Tax=Streptosporangium sp. CA-135522 TaxID=3240072 RepID=UPI003D8EFFD1